jgi:hypothetical protein
MVKPIDDKKWEDIVRHILHLEKIFALGIGKENSLVTLRIDGKTEPLTPEKFIWVIQRAAREGTTKIKPLSMEKSRASRTKREMIPFLDLRITH